MIPRRPEARDTWAAFLSYARVEKVDVTGEELASIVEYTLALEREVDALRAREVEGE